MKLHGLVGDDADDPRQLVLIQVGLHGRRDFGAGRRVFFSAGVLAGRTDSTTPSAKIVSLPLMLCHPFMG
jgi:hypothetical protein